MDGDAALGGAVRAAIHQGIRSGLDGEGCGMRARGINDDPGFLAGLASRPAFVVEEVRRDIAATADALHCGAVRVSGDDPERRSIAAGLAATAGLEVWCAPFPVDTFRDRLQTIASADPQWWTTPGPMQERLSGVLADGGWQPQEAFQGRADRYACDRARSAEERRTAALPIDGVPANPLR